MEYSDGLMDWVSNESTLITEGVWPMRQVFWREDRLARPATGLPIDALIPEAGWCDDPSSPLYNFPVALPFPLSHEKLWREDGVYDVIVVLGYNDDPPVRGKGSAIFLHLARAGYEPTQGCVAVSLPDLRRLLPRLGRQVRLVITP
jgi:L,D-peptidoglycan transpeptidase YkuD (ErfK/YbiS/YcfS/YnhG family)